MQDDGHMNLLSHDSFAAGIPHATFARMRRDAPLHWTDGDAETTGFWSLTRHEDVLKANKSPHLFSSAQGIRLEDMSRDEFLARRTVMEFDPPEHTGQRRLFNPSFAKPVVAQFEGLIRELAAEIVEKALQNAEFDAVEAIAKPLPMMMLGRILGVPDEDLEWLVEKGDALIGNSDPDFTSHVIDKMDTDAYRFMPFRSPAAVELFDYAADLLEKRRPMAQDGILARVMRSEDGLDALAFKNFFCLLVAAGNDTTRYSIAMALSALAHDPALTARLRAGDVWETCADEFIRFASPTLHFRRTATEDIDMHGQTIRTGDKVVLWFVAANRDETVFDQPDACLLDRRPNPHLSFGQGGVHVCLGMHLAKLEVRIVLEELMKRIDRFEALGAPSWTRSNFVTGVKSLTVRAVRAA